MQARQKQCCSIPQNLGILLLLSICQAIIFFSYKVRNLGFFYLDKYLSMKEHINSICKTASLKIQRISTIRLYHTDDATKTLVVSLLLSDIARSLVGKLQGVQNSAVQLVVCALPHVHSTPILRHLHWLPVTARIFYKTARLCVNAITSSTPLISLTFYICTLLLDLFIPVLYPPPQKSTL